MRKVSNRFRAAWARHRLAAHMFDRLLMGGSPDCPCARCARDRAYLAETGKPWTHPERTAYYRELDTLLERGRVRR